LKKLKQKGLIFESEEEHEKITPIFTLEERQRDVFVGIAREVYKNSR